MKWKPYVKTKNDDENVVKNDKGGGEKSALGPWGRTAREKQERKLFEENFSVTIIFKSDVESFVNINLS